MFARLLIDASVIKDLKIEDVVSIFSINPTEWERRATICINSHIAYYIKNYEVSNSRHVHKNFPGHHRLCGLL